MSNTTTLRDPALIAAVDGASRGGPVEPLFRLLARYSGLPGPRPNLAFATAVGTRIAEHGAQADALVAELCLTEEHARAGGVDDFFPICGAMAHAARFRAGQAPDRVFTALRPLAEDRRHLVRGGVIAALRYMAGGEGDLADRVAAALVSWSNGYLSAAVAIAALAERMVLDRIHGSEADVIRLLDEGFDLAENASRSDQRSQGYRALVEALSDAPATIMNRFGDPTAAWLERRAGTQVPELREAIERASAKARISGHGSSRVADIRAALSASAKERRDPLTYVGPTRQRGQKHGGAAGKGKRKGRGRA